MQAAALVINREGGILGHKVVIKSYDTGSNPTQAVTLVTQAVNSGTTWNFTYSGNTSDEQVAEGATVNRAKIIGIANNGLLALGDPNTYPYHFVNGSNADVVAKFLVENAQKQNFKKLALLTEDNSFGQQEHNSIGSALKAAGMQYIDSVFSATAVDISPALLQLQAQGVDGVIFNSLGASTGYVLKSRLKVGFMVPFIGDLGVSSGDVLGLAGGAEGIKNVTMQNWAMNIYDPARLSDPNVQKFMDALHSVVVTINQPLNQYATFYDGLRTMKLAAQQANSIDPDKLRTALEGLQSPKGYMLVFPQGYSWSKTSHQALNTPDQFGFIRPGQLVEGQVHPAA